MPQKTIKNIHYLKTAGKPIAAVTAYDYSSAKLIDKIGIPLILVGDSAAMVVLGYDNTLPVSVDEMVMLTAAVSRGVSEALVVADMPFMSYQSSVEDALRTGGRFIKDSGAGAVKLEGGKNMVPQIQALVDSGIPVMGHIGLTPQSYHQMSGYRVQGKTVSTAEKLINDAAIVEQAGAFSIVLEGIPSELSKMITESLSIPTIGIGAGPHCDGQIQVFHDLLGLYGDLKPKHTKRYIKIGSEIQTALSCYREDVENRVFPSPENYTHLKKDVLEQLQSSKNR